MLAAALIALAGCKSTPGGNSGSVNRRDAGPITKVSITYCGNFLNRSATYCAGQCQDPKVGCSYEICFMPGGLQVAHCFDDATKAEYAACAPGDPGTPAKVWPGCREVKPAQ